MTIKMITLTKSKLLLIIFDEERHVVWNVHASPHQPELPFGSTNSNA